MADPVSPVLARPKVNLFLHVTGRRPDGYHLLESLAVFPQTGDALSVEPSRTLSLSVSGPFGDGLAADGDNLVLRAAVALAERYGVADGAALHLSKNLPIASGIGGGSADASAALRILSDLWGVAATDADLEVLAATLGADCPVCIASRPRIMRGIGDKLFAAPSLPLAWMILVNPLRQVSTPAVFRGLGNLRGDAPLPYPREFADVAALAQWLRAETANDLEPSAQALAPEIGDVLAALTAQGVLLARMSGSGATCFGLVETERAARRTAAALSAAYPAWWCEVASFGP